jgi:hypothetical protein
MPWSKANLRVLRGQSNLVTSALIEIGTLCFNWPISRTSAIHWHQIGFFENSHLVEGICDEVLGYRIWWVVARAFRVVWLALPPFPTTLSPVKLGHHTSINSIRSFLPVPWFYHRQLQIQQNSISFRIVWCQIHSHSRLRFWVMDDFLFSVIREYPAFPAFPGLSRSLMWISILLSWFLIFSLDLSFILSTSLSDIRAIWSVSDVSGTPLLRTWPLFHAVR